MHAESSSEAPENPGKPGTATASGVRLLALAGNPNSGKTSVFNRLTGLRHKIGNYAGVTVERVEGNLAFEDGTSTRVVDLPGCYSLFSNAPDERIARDALLGLLPNADAPDALMVVVDASNLERNLYFVTQLLETGLPMCVALNMGSGTESRSTPRRSRKSSAFPSFPWSPDRGRTSMRCAPRYRALASARGSGRCRRSRKPP